MKRAFAGELDALLGKSPMSTARLTAVAKQHGIGYSTLRSWCTGVHLPRTPDDNADFRAFLFAVTADRAHAQRVLTLAIRAWRCAARTHRREPVAGVAATDVHAAYRLAGDDARRLLSWLCASRCRGMVAEAVAAMAGWPVRLTRQQLAALVGTGLVVRRAGERHAVPDIVRLMVGDHADVHADARLAAFYARTTLAAVRRLFPDLLEPAPLPGATPLRFTTDEAASTWLLTERDNLVAVAEAVHGRDQALTAALTDALGAAQQVRPHPASWAPLAVTPHGADGSAAARAAYAAGIAWWSHPAMATGLFAAAAAHWAGHQREQAAALHMLGAVEHALGDWASSVRHSTEALRIRRRLGEHRAQASSLVFLADAYLDLQKPEAAERHARDAIELAERMGYSAGTAGALGSLGRALLAQGLPDEAEHQFMQQQTLSQHLVFHSRTALALVGRALVCNHRGHFDSAIDLAEEAAAAALAGGHPAAEVDAYRAAVVAHRGRGRRTQAEALHQKALDLACRVGYRQALTRSSS